MSDPHASNELERIIKIAEVELRQIHPGLFLSRGVSALNGTDQRVYRRVDDRIGESCQTASIRFSVARVC